MPSNTPRKVIRSRSVPPRTHKKCSSVSKTAAQVSLLKHRSRSSTSSLASSIVWNPTILDARELVEDRLLCFRRDTWAAVFDTDEHFLCVLGGTDRDRITFLGVFDGIIQQIDQH